MNDRIARHMLISGHVQGVGYRDWAVRTARGLGLTGWVRNRSEGSVELVAEGDPALIEKLIDACRSGPSLARVDDIQLSQAEGGFEEFETRRTL